MAKSKSATVFFCQNCGYESSKWMGQCPGCKEWNSFVEETVSKTPHMGMAPAKTTGRGAYVPSVLAEISIKEEDRISTGIGELDRVLGGGIVQGSLT